MKLVLLPGMDGTGELFQPLVTELGDVECQVVTLPVSGGQSYQELADYVSMQLPDQGFVLLAESFSGPIAALLAKRGFANLKAVIFVATFLQPPKRFLLPFLHALPFQMMLSMPLSNMAIRAFCLGSDASDEQISWFKEVVQTVPEALLNRRVKVARALSLEKFVSDVPAIYIQSSNDKLVPASAWNKVKTYFKYATFRRVEGPHFLLQMRAVACAQLIKDELQRYS